jgi:hypothetical protein
MCDSFQFPSGHDGQALRLRDVEVRDWILDFWFRLHLSNLLCIQYTAQTSLCFRSQKISRVVAWFNWVQMGLTPSKMFFLWMWSIKRTYLGHLGSSLCVPSGVSAYCAFGLWNKIPGTLFREAICGYWTCGKKTHTPLMYRRAFQYDFAIKTYTVSIDRLAWCQRCTGDTAATGASQPMALWWSHVPWHLGLSDVPQGSSCAVHRWHENSGMPLQNSYTTWDTPKNMKNKYEEMHKNAIRCPCCMPTYVCISIYLSVSLSIYLPIYLSINLT